MVQILGSDPRGPAEAGPHGNAAHKNAAVRAGDRVRVRRQRWLVTEVCPHEGCAVVTLSGLGPVNLGVEQRVLTPFDQVEPLAGRSRLHIVRATRWRRACRALIADEGPSDSLRTARTARMDLMPHQLEPALAIVRGLGSRVLIADQVGLGKTVQAALVVAELRARGAAARVLVLAPAGLRQQWAEEFATRFDLHLALFDLPEITRRRALLPIGVNPWATEPMVVASLDYAKRPEVLAAVMSCRWDVVIVDEAHHLAAGTDRYEAVTRLCTVAPFVLLLTATPHSGDPLAFRSLCAIGQHDDTLLVFRRSRLDIGRPTERRVHRLRVRPSPAERQMHARLTAFVQAVYRDHGAHDPETWLALTTLRKRALSSAFALQRSVQRRLDALGDRPTATEQLPLPIGDLFGEFDAADAAPPWTIPSLSDGLEERALLTGLSDAARAASRHETKLAALARLLRRTREPALVFTEYRDTLLHVRAVVAPGAPVIHGGLSREERQAALARFARGGVLLATDAAGEGLNLHHACRSVINLELPWNPMRLEQRIGRVDRIGQTRRVHVFYLIAAGTDEIRLLDRLAARVAQAQADVGAPNPLTSDRRTPDSAVSFARASGPSAEATAEHTRLIRARVMDGPREREGGSRAHQFQTESDPGALVCFSKRREVRVCLGSQILVVLQSTLSDDTGRLVASHLIPVLVRAQREIRRSLHQLQALGSQFADDTYRHWLTTASAAHDAFWQTWLDRERAMARSTDGVAATEAQPGLFDRRADHARGEMAAARHEVLSDLDRRVSVAARAASVHVLPPRPVLILLP